MRIILITGDGPERCFALCRSGPDAVVTRACFSIVRRTWLRWTRFTPQTFARVLMAPLIAANIADAWIDGEFDHHLGGSLSLVITATITLFLVWILNRLADATAGLNEEQPPLRALMAVDSALRIRGLYACIVLFLIGFTTGFNPTSVQSWMSNVSLIIWVLAYFSLTMGRTAPPAKKQRERFTIRLPHLARAS